MSTLPRDKPAIGGRRRRIGETPAAAPAPAPATPTASEPAPAAAAASTQAKAPRAPKAPKAKPSTASNRPPGTSRLALDVPEQLADDFRARAKKKRFSQHVALAGALQLLEQLDDAAYETLLNEVLENGR